MAYLNVRERRLEAKIAYVGPAQSGKGTNFAQLGGGTPEDDLLALVWRPKEDVSFRDCDVRVKLVTARGEASAERVRGLLRDVDGVVFVADAAPDAASRNRDALAAVKAALGADPARDVPIVVQVNKRDLPDALPAAAVVAPLDAALPWISAAATLGEGVTETAERALAAVLETLRARGPLEAEPPAAPAREGNPLLTALRGVLRESIAAQVEVLEAKLVARLDAAFAAGSAAAEARLAARLAEPNGAGAPAAEARLVACIEEALAAQISAVEGRLEAKLDRVLASHGSVTAKVLEQREALAALDAAVRGATGELGKLLDGTARGVREQGTTLGTTRRAIDAVLAEVKEAREAGQQESRASAEKLARDVAALGPRFVELERGLARQLQEATAGLGAQVHHVGLASGEGRAELGGKVDELRAQLDGLIDELKKSKKGWFG